MLFPCIWEKGAFLFYPAEAVVQRGSVKKVFLEISQNSQVNTCARVSFLIKLQASGFFWIPFFLVVEVSIFHVLYQFHEIKLNVMKYTLNYVSWNSLKEIFHSVSPPIQMSKQNRRLLSPWWRTIRFLQKSTYENIEQDLLVILTLQETKNSKLIWQKLYSRGRQMLCSTWRKLTLINRHWTGKLLLSVYVSWKKL